MKRKYLSFAVGLAAAIVIVVLLVGCKRAPPEVIGKSGVQVISSVLVAEAEGCKIYSVDTKDLPVSYLFLSKCDFDKTSSVNIEYPMGKVRKSINNSTLPPAPPSALERAMDKLSPEDKVQMMVEMRALVEQADKE